LLQKPTAGEARQGRGGAQKGPVRDRQHRCAAAELPHVDTFPMECMTLPALRKKQGLEEKRRVTDGKSQRVTASAGQIPRLDTAPEARGTLTELDSGSIGQQRLESGLRDAMSAAIRDVNRRCSARVGVRSMLVEWQRATYAGVPCAAWIGRDGVLMGCSMHLDRTPNSSVACIGGSRP